MRRSALILLILFLGITKIPAQVKIYGFVIDFENAHPIDGATVFIHDEYNIAFNPPVNTITDETGYFEFPDMDYGKYSVNAYIYFEFKDDSVAFVYQPGVFNVRDSINTYFKEKGFPINFGFSPTNIKKQYEFRNSLSSVALFDSTSRIEFPFKPAVFEFTKPRVIAVDNLFYKTESSFFEKKNW